MILSYSMRSTPSGAKSELDPFFFFATPLPAREVRMLGAPFAS
jgi:hypothetical protein